MPSPAHHRSRSRRPRWRRYDANVAWEILGPSAAEQDVQDRAALIFGLFTWECIMNRDDRWAFYDPNLSPTDPNREIIGKVHLERES